MDKQEELRKSLIALIKVAALREIPLVPTYGDLEKRGAGDISNPRVRFVLPYEDQHLLQMAISPKWKGWMRHAGGGIEEGETAQEAALREFEEEFGKKLKLEQLRHLGADPRDEFSTHQFYEVLDHGLSPATYQASNDPDEIVQLVKALQFGDRYLGPDVSAWEKQSAHVAELLEAKKESDRKNYAAKHDILRKLIKKSPAEFKIDSEEGGIYGITHIPSGFKIHIPKSAVPEELRGEPEDDVYVQSAVPAASLDLVRKHGLLSSQALLNNPEALEGFLGNRVGTEWYEDEEEFKKRIEEKLKDTFWSDAARGPSVFFGDPDPEKITDVHPMRKLKAETIRVNLSKLLRDYPETRIAGNELQPYDPEGPEHQGDLRHYDIDLDKVREYAATDPKELWKHYNDPEGARYAGNVPHAQIITPSGGIPSEYLDFGEKQGELLTRYESGGRGTWDVGKEEMPEELLQKILESKAWLKRPELPEGEYTSYFTPSGAEKYEKTLLPIHRKYLAEIDKKQQERSDTEPAYEDEHQVLYEKQAEGSLPERILVSELPANVQRASSVTDATQGGQGAFKSTDTLGGQVQKYYKNAPGGFPQAVRDAVSAQDRRRSILPTPADTRLEDYSRWKPSDLKRPVTNYWVPADKENNQYMSSTSMTQGWHVPRAGINPHIVTVFPKTVDNLMTMDGIEGANPLSTAVYPPQPVRTYNKEPQYTSGGIPFTPGMEISEQQQTREHELTHHATLGGIHRLGQMLNDPLSQISTSLGGPGVGYNKPAKFPQRNPTRTPETVDKRYWNYMTTPAELDPRIAEIKRSYIAAHPGSTVRTDAEAQRAWKWWGKHLDKHPFSGSWRGGQYWKRLNQDPVEREAILKRMQELVRSDSPVGQQVLYEKQAEKEPWRIERSVIHGKGLFATQDIPVGGRVAHSASLEKDDVGLEQWELSEAARYTNHSRTPNTTVDSDGSKMTMVATEPIEDGEEIRVSYFQVGKSMSPGQRLTHGGRPMRTVSTEELSKWAKDIV
jgi:8-oxo-dGTP pyrophosphatase MutT (NUDIX family)